MRFIFILAAFCFAAESSFDLLLSYDKQHKITAGTGLTIYWEILSEFPIHFPELLFFKLEVSP